MLLCFEKKLKKIWRNFENFIENFESVFKKNFAVLENFNKIFKK